MSALAASDIAYWDAKLRDTFGLNVRTDGGAPNPHILYRQLYLSVSRVPPALIRACGVTDVLFKSDMGESKAFSPNHGYYIGHNVGLNVNCFSCPDHPEDFSDQYGYSLGRAAQTVLHELGHGFDYWGGDLAQQPAWMALSGWSREPKKGLVQLHIKEPVTPEIFGEMYYDPKAEFTRFYGKRNSYDDFADCFAFYVAGLKSKVPANKRAYLDDLLGKYYK